MNLESGYSPSFSDDRIDPDNSGIPRRDITGGFGANVVLVMTLMNGDVIRETMPVGIASAMLKFNDIENGVVFRSGHIEYGGIIDAWGESA